jgi:signal transduction histidine kinase
MIFYYGVGTAGFNAAYPFSAANLNLSIATAGPAAIGGLALTALGLLLMAWALICAVFGQFSEDWDRTSPERMERKRLEQQQRLEQAERKRLEQQERLMKQEERLRASYPRD